MSDDRQPIRLSHELLAKLAERHRPPQWWYDSPEEDLFGGEADEPMPRHDFDLGGEG